MHKNTLVNHIKHLGKYVNVWTTVIGIQYLQLWMCLQIEGSLWSIAW